MEPIAGTDARIQQLATEAARKQEIAVTRRRAHPCAFYACSEHGQHVCRAIAKVCCLGRVRSTRHDAEGCADVDVEVLSDPRWKKWKSQLSFEQRQALTHWRAGAVAAPARQQGSSRLGRSTACSHCGHLMASARHLWAECPYFSSSRQTLEAAHGLDPLWWTRQPRITAKTGWITHGAALSSSSRCSAMIAANALGIEVVQSCWAVHAELARPSRGRAHSSTIRPP